MRPINLKNIRILLSLGPVHTSIPRHLFPPHWKSNQQVPEQSNTLGEKIKKHRLKLHWLQTDVADRFNTSSASVSNWERGITIPSRRMKKRIAEFLGYTPPSFVPTCRVLNSPCQICGISKDSPERCPFELVCNSFIKNKM
jgi:DNA-binding XRE family transcriptional regulator